MGCHQSHGQRASRQQHGKVIHSGPRREELRLTRVAESGFMEMFFADRSGHHGGQLPSHASPHGFLERGNRQLGAIQVRVPRIPRQGIADHLETHPIGRLEQGLCQQFGTNTRRITSHQTDHGVTSRLP